MKQLLKFLLVVTTLLLLSGIVLSASSTGISLIMGTGSGTSPTGISLVVGDRGTGPVDDCEYVSGDWVIDDGSDCILSTITNIGDNHFSLISGSVKIESTGGIRAKGCFINNGQPFFIKDNGIFYCNG